MKQQKEFDRSVCMSIFCDHYEQAEKILNTLGKEVGFDYYHSIVKYGLFGIKPDDPMINLLISETTFKMIDQSQNKRARGFSGKEDLELSKKIIELYLSKPGISQNAIAFELQCSKGKVNSTLQKYHNGHYKDIISNTYSNTDADAITCNDRDRDRFAVPDTDHSSDIASLTKQASPAEIEETNKTFIYKDEILVMKLFQQHKRPSEICSITGFPSYFVNASIDKFRENNNRLPKPPVDYSKMIMCTDGNIFMNKEEYFNDCTNNGKNKINEMPWDIIKSNLIEYKAIDPDGIINEMKEKLLDIQSK